MTRGRCLSVTVDAMSRLVADLPLPEMIGGSLAASKEISKDG